MSGGHIEDWVDLVAKDGNIGRFRRMKWNRRGWCCGFGVEPRRIRCHEWQRPKQTGDSKLIGAVNVEKGKTREEKAARLREGLRLDLGQWEAEPGTAQSPDKFVAPS